MPQQETINTRLSVLEQAAKSIQDDIKETRELVEKIHDGLYFSDGNKTGAFSRLERLESNVKKLNIGGYYIVVGFIIVLALTSRIDLIQNVVKIFVNI